MFDAEKEMDREQARREAAVVEAARKVCKLAAKYERGEVGNILVVGAWGMLKDAVTSLEELTGPLPEAQS